MHRAKVVLCGSTLFVIFCSAWGSAVLSRQANPPRVELETIATGLQSPLYVTSALDGTNRLFVVEQPGRIQIIEQGASTRTTFLDIVGKVLAGGERGLLGLAFHPNFESNRRFFVNYTRRPDGATVIAEYRASVGNANVADVEERVLLVIAQPFANHNGGMIEFGPDGFLYIGMGDGGSANDPGNRAQNVNDLLGKMLRIDVNSTSGGLPYASPSDNPFFGATAGRDEIYALGLRNPFRFSFDRVTGQLYAGDVGQNQREEIDIITRGGNYGWRVWEANTCTGLGPGPCTTSGYVFPIADYSHAGGRCSITGGYVYRGTKSTLPTGAYVYGDFCTGEIFMLNGGAQSLLLDTGLSLASFGEDESGELYVVGLGGTVQRLINIDSPPPPPPSPFRVDSVTIRRRSSGDVLDPVTVKGNGKKFEVVVRGAGFVPGAVIRANGRDLNTNVLSSLEMTARFHRSALSAPGTLTLEVINGDGSRSNPVAIPIAPDPD